MSSYQESLPLNRLDLISLLLVDSSTALVTLSRRGRRNENAGSAFFWYISHGTSHFKIIEIIVLVLLIQILRYSVSLRRFCSAILGLCLFDLRSTSTSCVLPRVADLLKIGRRWV